MERAAERTEENQMGKDVFEKVELYIKFFQIQTALDKVTDPESRTILEEQKKEITERLQPK